MNVITLISEIRAIYPDWTHRKALHEIDKARSIFLKNKINQGRVGNESAMQVLADIPMIIVDQSELFGFDTMSKILRSKYPIPSPIEYQNMPYNMVVRDPRVLGEAFNLIPAENAQYAGNGRANQRDVFVFVHNDYLYIKLNRNNPKLGLISQVVIKGIFEVPTDVIAVNNPDFYGRDFWNQEYPLSVADWLYVKNMIIGKPADETE